MEPFAKSECEVNGFRLAYHEEGTGETVLLVHGITTHSFIWKRMIPHLSNNRHVIAVDLPGCGASSKELTKPYSLKNHAFTLKCLLDELGIEQIHLVGHDVGGGIGQIFAVQYPDRIYDLTLINSVAYDFWPVQPIIAMRTPIIRQLAMASLDMGTLRSIVHRGLFHKERLTPELMDYFQAPLKTREGRKAFLHFASSLDNQDLMEIRESLRHLALPVLIIRGESDVYLSGAIAERLAAEIPNAQSVRIPTGNHFIQEDEPEQVSNAILQFFEAH